MGQLWVLGNVPPLPDPHDQTGDSLIQDWGSPVLNPNAQLSIKVQQWASPGCVTKLPPA